MDRRPVIEPTVRASAVDQCNAEVQHLLSDSMQHLLDDAAAREKRRKNPDRPSYPITALPLVGGDVSLSAQIIKHRARAVLVSNEVTELWLPRSQVRRTVQRGKYSHEVIVTEWIAARKSRFLMFIKNQSPQYLEWLEKERAEAKRRLENPYRGPGFECKFDHM